MMNKITSKLPNGDIISYDVILTFKNDKNNRDYIVYTDNSVDSDNKLRIYASIYNPLTNEFIGNPTSKEEWDDIYKLLDNVILNK